VGEGLAGPSSLSVVIVAYRSGPALERCLRALREHSPDAEVIVVDNHGGEEVGEGVQLLRPGENLGFAAGCNLGASKAAGPILVFLNPDAVVSDGALERLVARLADPKVGIAMARLCLLDRPDELNSGGTMIHVSGLAWAGRFGEPAASIVEAEDVAAASGAALAVRSATFCELGGFTDELFMYHEDVELSWRAHLRGLRVVVEPGADVLHEYDFDRNMTKIALLERNRLIFVLTAYSPRLLLLLAPVLTLGELAMLAVAARGGWFRGKLGGWWWLASHPRWLARHRRETQRLRTVRDRELVRFLTPTLDPKMASVPRGTGFLNRVLAPYWSAARRVL
jgi:GT2 family glycosyltransferase